MARRNDIVTVAGEGLQTLWVVTQVDDAGNCWVVRVRDGLAGGWENNRKITVVPQADKLLKVMRAKAALQMRRIDEILAQRRVSRYKK